MPDLFLPVVALWYDNGDRLQLPIAIVSRKALLIKRANRWIAR
jgi:hypothetical protein